MNSARESLARRKPAIAFRLALYSSTVLVKFHGPLVSTHSTRLSALTANANPDVLRCFGHRKTLLHLAPLLKITPTWNIPQNSKARNLPTASLFPLEVPSGIVVCSTSSRCHDKSDSFSYMC